MNTRTHVESPSRWAERLTNWTWPLTVAASLGCSGVWLVWEAGGLS